MVGGKLVFLNTVRAICWSFVAASKTQRADWLQQAKKRYMRFNKPRRLQQIRGCWGRLRWVRWGTTAVVLTWGRASLPSCCCWRWWLSEHRVLVNSRKGWSKLVSLNTYFYLEVIQRKKSCKKKKTARTLPDTGCCGEELWKLWCSHNSFSLF